MQASFIASAPMGTFFTYGAIALVVTALVLFVGITWRRSCSAPGAAEGFTYMGALSKSVSPKETQQVMAAAAAAPMPMPSTAPPMMTPAPPAPAVEVPAEEGPVAAEPSAPTFEGFAGPARGAGMPDCIRSSKDAAALYEMMLGKVSSTEEGADDLRELQLILSKISCFKRDLTGAAGVVAATRTQPFSTAHDLEAVAETTARCFAKTIPQRDLALSLDKWGSRGTFLLKRLCTSFGFTDHEDDEAMGLFGRAMADITDIAMSRCCNSAGEATIAGVNQPRMVAGYEAPGLNELREYKGYY